MLKDEFGYDDQDYEHFEWEEKTTGFHPIENMTYAPIQEITDKDYLKEQCIIQLEKRLNRDPNILNYDIKVVSSGERIAPNGYPIFYCKFAVRANIDKEIIMNTPYNGNFEKYLNKATEPIKKIKKSDIIAEQEQNDMVLKACERIILCNLRNKPENIRQEDIKIIEDYVDIKQNMGKT